MEAFEHQNIPSCTQKDEIKTECKPRDPIREILDSLCNKPSNPDNNGESSKALVTSNVDFDTSAFTPVANNHNSSVCHVEPVKSCIPPPFITNFTDWYSLRRFGLQEHRQNYHQYPLLISGQQPNTSNPYVGYFSDVSSLLCTRGDMSVLNFYGSNRYPNLQIPASPRYQCDQCKKSYSTFGGLSKHKQFHCTTQIKKDFSCKFCGKSYGSLGALKMHIRTHTLPCKCKLCGKAFSRPWLLQGHMRTHTGEKPFSCAHCGRAFADRSNLRAHLQTHSDVKKYGCKSCKKTFSRMSLLAKHREGRVCELPVQ